MSDCEKCGDSGRVACEHYDKPFCVHPNRHGTTWPYCPIGAENCLVPCECDGGGDGLRERYRAMREMPWFKEAYEGMSVGDRDDFDEWHAMLVKCERALAAEREKWARLREHHEGECDRLVGLMPGYSSPDDASRAAEQISGHRDALAAMDRIEKGE